MVRIVLLAIAILGALALLVRVAQGLQPPDTVRFAAGIEGGGYWRFAERYRDILARDGIDLVLVPTAGSVENARLLGSGEAEAALLQGGVAIEGRDGAVETLGAVFVEPMLIFAREGGTRTSPVPANVARWRGLRIAAGAPGSGTRAAASALFEAASLPDGANELVPLSGADAAGALLAGEVDVALFVAPLSAPYLEPLLDDPGVALAPVDHVTALSRRIRQAELIDVPSGAFGLDPPRPPRDRRLIGLVANLVASGELHAAAVDRLVMAAVEVHGPGDVLVPPGRFPGMDGVALPKDGYARDLLADGPSVLNDYLPYWVVAQISGVAILLLPIVFLLLPLLRMVPTLYAFGIRRQVFTHYDRIRQIDVEAADTDDPARLAALYDELERIDRDIATLSLPLAYRDYAYNARLHVDLLRGRIAPQVADRPVATGEA